MLVTMAAAAVAGPFEDGSAAYRREDYVTAYRLWRPLADQGNSQAQAHLGLMYEAGHGVQQDYAEAEKWYRKAAEQGLAEAQLLLGSLYVRGLGVPVYHAEAMKWWRKAAEQGLAEAQGGLGNLYFHRYGDYVNAYIWFSLAASQIAVADDFHNWTVGERDLLASKMTPAELAEAQKLLAFANQNPISRVKVKLKRVGGTFVVPVQINGAITLDFTVDSGAADVSVPADVFSTLIRTGSIGEADILGEQTYVLADGSTSREVKFTIRSLKIGDKVVENVTGSVAPARGTLLLGHLERFKSWSIDNTRHVLLLQPR